MAAPWPLELLYQMLLAGELMHEGTPCLAEPTHPHPGFAKVGGEMPSHRIEQAGRPATEVHKTPYAVQEFAQDVVPLQGQMFLIPVRC